MSKTLWFLIVFVLFYALNAQARNSRLSKKLKSGRRVVGGKTADLQYFPWQIGLFESAGFFCGGSIVSANYVLTAAHCLGKVDWQGLYVQYSTSKIFSGGSTIHVSNVIVHPEFVGKHLDWAHDIAVLQLESAIQFSNVANAIALSSKMPSTGDVATISGWGSKSYPHGPTSLDLQVGKVNILDRQTCLRFVHYLHSNMVCAKTFGVGHCTGDSGGALTIDSKQVGIVSFRPRGDLCADPYYPEVYTSVFQYKDFIDQHTQNTAIWV